MESLCVASIAETLREAHQRLDRVSDTPRLDAELLMADALGVSRSHLLLHHRDKRVPEGFATRLERRLEAEPVAYILGRCEFYGIDLAVTREVLIPRGDSECVVEAALGVCPAKGRVLDLGTGSGALLLAMLSQRAGLSGTGIDASAGALEVARGNGEALGLAARARFLRRDWTHSGWAADLGRFDCVIANPPYVETAAQLDRAVKDYEPAAALFAGEDGLDAYRKLIPQLPGLMTSGAKAVFEIGSSQAEAVGRLAADAGLSFEIRNDLANRSRALVLS